MATQSQIIANRQNARKSTGPRTADGKAIVSQNAFKHGLTADHGVIGSENLAEFELYRDRFLNRLLPVGPMEYMLAERIISLSWRLKRVVSIQNQTIDALNTDDTPGPLAKLTKSLFPRAYDQPHTDPYASGPDLTLGRMAIKDFSNARVLERLLMYERRMENSLYRTIIELQRLQLIRELGTERETPFNQ